ncbi:M23 family metallopeptidase [Campylobacter troglodytis]|uniref:M23 family metallopeptidase n=1 Tax=Campylobacter troglodytis TaxID=654363 RepID=UPI00115A3B2F|nr:M23 family metallopeptidase [Campylobacter troglodytis]TQR58137.1 M23 family peptidase [Campylobacter troglodytis]
MKKVFFVIFALLGLVFADVRAENSAYQANQGEKKALNSASQTKQSSTKQESTKQKAPARQANSAQTKINSSSDFNSTSKQNLNISKGQVLFLSFDKQGLKGISSTSNLYKKEQKHKFFAHPTKDNKVVLVFSSAYKKPIKKAKITALYKSGQSLKYDLLGNEGFYPKEFLKVDQSKITPPKEVLARIEKELSEANAVYATYTDESLFDGKFILPINSAITSKFGTARLFNQTLASYHSGVDFRALVGTPIVAANDGIVRIAKDRYYAGGSIVIDHGHKIFSQYYHLSELKVKVGQKVKKGEVIALSGDSGRVTGAHLHFGIFAGGTQVDPLDFIEKFNALFDD